MRRGFLFLAGVLLLSVSQLQAADLKVGVVDIQRVIRESAAGEETRTSFAKEVGDKRKIIFSKEEALKALDEDVRKDRGDLHPQQRADKEERLAKEVKELKRLKDDVEEELRRKESEMVQRLMSEVVGVVNKVAEEGKFSLIIEKKQGGVVYLQDALDITPKVIEKYNIQRQKK